MAKKCLIKNNKIYTPNGEESILYNNLKNMVGEVEAKELFLLSHTPTFKQEIIEKSLKEYRDRLPKSPQGVSFKETFVNKIRTFHIYEGKKKVGRIQLSPNKEGFKVKSVLVNEDVRGKGFGKALYIHTISELIQENSIFYTDVTRTDEAERVWNSLQKMGLTEDKKTVTPFPKESFYINGEVKAETVTKYVEDNLSSQQELSEAEKTDLINLDVDVETSEDLYEVLHDIFYKDGVFNPDIKKMQKIYSDAETRQILEDVEIQARIKETVEKLRNTEEFNIIRVEVDEDFTYKTLELNTIGQFKVNNPLQDKIVYTQQSGGEGYVKIPTIDEEGNVVEEKLIYDNAVKIVDDEKVIRAVNAVVNAPQNIETDKVESKIHKWLLNYGLDVSNLSREDYPALLNFINNPSEENIIVLEETLGFERKPKEAFIKITPSNRTYKQLKTVKTEQQLFDELSLIKTNILDVYHQINKIDEQEMRDIMENQDETVPMYQLYKEYYKYSPRQQFNDVQPIIRSDYLMNEFVADFAAEKLKNPNDEFYQQFKVTENGIELISNDAITLAKVNAQIETHSKLADYSVVSKSLSNLKRVPKNIIQTKEDRRVVAANNKENLPTPKTELSIINDNFIEAKEETEEFLRIGNNIYEQQEQGIYAKLEFAENPFYYTMEINAPEFMLIEKKETMTPESEIKQLTDKKTDEENFSCLK